MQFVEERVFVFTAPNNWRWQASYFCSECFPWTQTVHLISRSRQLSCFPTADTWHGDFFFFCFFYYRHADTLVQLDNGKKIPPKGWKCEKCDKTDNLWLNLTDGSVLCGRKFFDGSGGNNHAVDHYGDTKYPLAVKLGTITPDGAGVCRKGGVLLAECDTQDLK